jgi:hypothetical protein
MIPQLQQIVEARKSLMLREHPEIPLAYFEHLNTSTAAWGEVSQNT